MSERQKVVERTVKLFRHRQEEAKKDVFGRSRTSAQFYLGQCRAYEFCADYIEFNFREE